MPPSLRWASTLALGLALTSCGASSNEDDERADTAGGEGEAADHGFGVRLSPELSVGGQPTDADLRAAADAGVTHVITLRTEAEPGQDGEQARVEGLGMRFTRIPVPDATGLTVENARLLDAALTDEPTVLHCGSGNRAGALLGLHAYVTGELGANDAVLLAERAGMTNLGPTLRERIDAHAE